MSMAKSLAIVLTEPPTLVLLPAEVGDSVSLRGKGFVDSGLGDWIGFYDWLRTRDGKLLGVRSWLDEMGAEDLRRTLAQNSAVELGKGDVRVWFSADRDFDEAFSADQDLGTHRIVRAGADEFALTFNVERLSESELQTLLERALLVQ